jgi:hypothetical protein
MPRRSGVMRACERLGSFRNREHDASCGSSPARGVPGSRTALRARTIVLAGHGYAVRMPIGKRRVDAQAKFGIQEPEVRVAVAAVLNGSMVSAATPLLTGDDSSHSPHSRAWVIGTDRHALPNGG